jgi:hypothetical protein
MKTSENIDQLATALAAAQSEMKNAKLNKVNPHFKSKYADLAEIRDTITPALTKHGIALLNGTEPMENALHVVTRLVHKSGQWAESRFPVPYDKPQAMGSGITYGKRYNEAALTNIAADEDDDATTANEKAVEKPKQYDHNPLVRKACDDMIKAIRLIEQVGSLIDLRDYWENKANADTFKSLPASYKEAVLEAKDEAKTALEAKVPA